MENKKTLNKHYEAIAWGIGFIWVGIYSLIPGNQNSIGVLGIGIILLGLNLARLLSQIPINLFSTVLGFLASTLGLAVLFRPVLNFPHFELDFFALLLIATGLYILIPGPKRVESD